jgi:hypothetical protein
MLAATLKEQLDAPTTPGRKRKNVFKFARRVAE